PGRHRGIHHGGAGGNYVTRRSTDRVDVPAEPVPRQRRIDRGARWRLGYHFGAGSDAVAQRLFARAEIRIKDPAGGGTHSRDPDTVEPAGRAAGDAVAATTGTVAAIWQSFPPGPDGTQRV